jgi:hypothetical protein
MRAHGDGPWLAGRGNRRARHHEGAYCGRLLPRPRREASMQRSRGPTVIWERKLAMTPCGWHSGSPGKGTQRTSFGRTGLGLSGMEAPRKARLCPLPWPYPAAPTGPSSNPCPRTSFATMGATRKCAGRECGDRATWFRWTGSSFATTPPRRSSTPAPGGCGCSAAGCMAHRGCITGCSSATRTCLACRPRP